MMEKAVYCIYAPSYDEKIGGSIVLHQLCDLINREGGDAYLYPTRPDFNIKSPIFSLFDIILHFLKKNNFKRLSTLNTPIISRNKIENAVIIYPEITSGNPLKAKKVIRWLLHKPGFHTGLIKYNSGDIIFYYQEAFNDQTLGLKVGGKLQVIHLLMDIYKKKNFGERSGTCYLLRKGRGREIVHDLNNSILIDNLSHEEIAEVFNRVEKLISYDAYTLYSQYAAICGCLSIVVPEVGVSKEAWQPIEELRYGISYGFDDTQWAKETQERAVDYLKTLQVDSIKSVRNFLDFCNHHFY